MRPLEGHPETWAVYREELTGPQRRTEEALADHWCVVNLAANRVGKTRNLARICTKCLLGAYDWAPAPAHVAIITKAKHTASTAIEDYLQEFIRYGLPAGYVRRSVTRDELTSPIRLKNDARLDVKSETMGAERLQGAGYNLAGFDEFPKREPWKEIRARAKAGVALKFLVAMTPTHGFDWFIDEIVQPAKEGKRAGIALVGASIFENGTPGCRTCGRNAGAWDAVLGREGLRREWRNHAALKARCGHCHTFGVQGRIQPDVIAEMEQEFTGVEFGVRLYGALEDPRASRCFTAAEIQALRTGTRAPIAEGGVAYFDPILPATPCTGGVDAAEGLGADHSETAACFLDATSGVQVGLFADDDCAFQDYRETIDFLATRRFNGAFLVIERKSLGVALLEEYKDRPHLHLYRQRDEGARGHVSGVTWGWVSHHASRDTLLKNAFVAIRKNLVYAEDGTVTMRSEPDPRGLWIRDRETVEQLRHLFYDATRGQRISRPAQRRDDRVIALGLAHEGRMHRRDVPWSAAHGRSPMETWQDAVLSRRQRAPLVVPELEAQADGTMRYVERPA